MFFILFFLFINFVVSKNDYIYVFLNGRIFFVGSLLNMYKLMNYFGFFQVKRLTWIKFKKGSGKKKINKELNI